MKVQLSIKDDTELRNYIKDMIRGTVKSIAREEIRGIIKEAFERKAGAKLTQPVVDSMIEDELRHYVKNALKGYMHFDENTIRGMAREIVGKEIQDFFSKRNPLK